MKDKDIDKRFDERRVDYYLKYLLKEPKNSSNHCFISINENFNCFINNLFNK
jgi:hypothetical protein